MKIRFYLGLINLHKCNVKSTCTSSKPLPVGLTLLYSKSMSVFTQNFNPLLGKIEWEEQHEEYDYYQEIARSAYADMLHDKERNDKYCNALKIAIKRIKEQNRPVRVLDIGTGTGLLSMMAARHGAEKVTACEAFQPMARCALSVIQKNGFHQKIKVIPKRSTELTVGNGCDLEEKANILVTEVFDTELIGEGAIETFHHALKNLLEEDCIVIPTSATVFAQIVESERVLQWSKLERVPVLGTEQIFPPQGAETCPGAAGAHDLQLTQLPTIDFVPITDPVVAFRFDFSGKNELNFKDHSKSAVEAKNSGTCQAVFMWWQLEMVPGGEILSCAPSWAHPTQVEWRDHWLQAIYYLKDELSVSARESFCLKSHHDQYSFWFSVGRSQLENSEKVMHHPICECGIHTLLSHNRIGMLNDKERNFKFVNTLKKIIKPDSVCLSLSDGSLLPFMAGKVGAKKVYAFEPNYLIREVMASYLEENKLGNIVSLIASLDDLEEVAGKQKIDVLIAEPYFLTSVLPWDNLHFWHLCSELKEHLSSSATIVPAKATIWGVAVRFLDLWKIRAPVGNVNSFDLQPFDEIIQHSLKIIDEKIEPQPLWEYPCSALTEKFEVLTFDLTQSYHSASSEAAGAVPFQCSGSLNGIALWVDYNLHADTILSTGPISSIIPGEQVSWYRFCKQGVHFMPLSNVHDGMKLKYYARFLPNSGDISFSFDVGQ